MTSEAVTTVLIRRLEACPSCRSTRFVRVGTSVASFSTIVGDQVFEQPAFEARKCVACQLVYKSAVASEAVLAEYYAKVDFRKWEISGLFPTERVILEKLRELPKSSRILDFGCSSGRLLQYVVASHTCFGCEINPPAIEVATARGLTVLSPNVLEARDYLSFFDAIVLSDVFEHFVDSLDLLEGLFKTLRAGGILIVSTGNSDAPTIVQNVSRSWYFQNIEHVCMLNLGHARFIAERLGMKITSVTNVSHYSPPFFQRFKLWAQLLAFNLTHTIRFQGAQLLFQKFPVIRRARKWPRPPVNTFGKDHLVLVFQRSFERN